MINYDSSIDETDKFRNPHNYRILYQNFLTRQPKRILEIGTSSCGFAKFLKDNNIGEWIVGADLKKDIVSGHIPSNLTWGHMFDDFFEGDATSQKFLDWLEKKDYRFNLVIDDASHTLAMQKYLISMANVFLEDNGVYVTEDIASYGNAKEIIKSVPEELKKYAYIADLTDAYQLHDDMCVVIDKGRL